MGCRVKRFLLAKIVVCKDSTFLDIIWHHNFYWVAVSKCLFLAEFDNDSIKVVWSWGFTKQ